MTPSLSLRSPRKRKGRAFLPANSPFEDGDENPEACPTPVRGLSIPGASASGRCGSSAPSGISGRDCVVPGRVFFRSVSWPRPIPVQGESGIHPRPWQKKPPHAQSDLRANRFDRLRNVRPGFLGNGLLSRLRGHGGASEIPRDLPGELELAPSHLGEEDPGEEISSLRNPGRKVELHLEGVGVPEGVSATLALAPREPFRVRLVQSFQKDPVKVLEGLLPGVRSTRCQKANPSLERHRVRAWPGPRRTGSGFRRRAAQSGGRGICST